MSPASDDHSFLTCLDQAWPKRWPIGAAVVSVTLHGLSPAQADTDDLFANPKADAIRQRWLTISQTLDQINRRYGGDIISLGPRVDPPGGYAGAKIAFGRIPDLADF